MAIPFLRPTPPRLSELLIELLEIEQSGHFSNYGPVNTRFEQQLTRTMFADEGGCLTVNNATIGLMLAIKQAAQRKPAARYALMPSFTFAATAHAALWAGLTPLLCDIEEDTWLSCPRAEDALIEQFGDEIAVIVPYATFGNCLSLSRYNDLQSKHGIGVVVDAAASLGSIDEAGRGFGTGSRVPVVYSMHVTKTFATAEAGVIYSADHDLISELRTMGNFGFGQPRSATMPGLNSKLPEVVALLALKKLESFDRVVTHREAVASVYKTSLTACSFQALRGRRHAYQFMPALLAPELSGHRRQILATLGGAGIGFGSYFSPHLAEQPYFQQSCKSGPLPLTEHIASRIISLPMSDVLTPDETRSICAVLQDAIGEAAAARGSRRGI